MIVVPVCEEGDVRLVPVGNVNGSGRVEMCLDREWRIVGDETWGVEEATVVCRQLGLPTDGQESNNIITKILQEHCVDIFLIQNAHNPTKP